MKPRLFRAGFDKLTRSMQAESRKLDFYMKKRVWEEMRTID